MAINITFRFKDRNVDDSAFSSVDLYTVTKLFLFAYSYNIHFKKCSVLCFYFMWSLTLWEVCRPDRHRVKALLNDFPTFLPINVHA